MSGCYDDRTERVLIEIMQERARQVVIKNYTPADDDGLVAGELARMAAVHAMLAAADVFPPCNEVNSVEWKRASQLWPRVRGRPPYQGARRHLVIAAALIVAEIGRRDHIAARADAISGAPDPEVGP